MAERELKVVVTAQDDASAKLKGIGDNLNKVAANFRSTGLAMVKLGAAPTAALGFAAKAAITFESAFAGVRKTVEASEEEFAQLSQNFRDISKEAPASAAELARIGELAGQLGVSGVDNITKFAKTIADVVETSNLTADAAATEFARLASIMNEPINNVDRMASVVIELGNNFATTEAEITGFAQRMAASGNLVGFTTGEVLALSAAFTSVGVDAAAGGTSVQKTVFTMAQAIATGSEELQVFADTAGVTVDEFTTMFEQSASGAFEKFVVGLGNQGLDAISTLDGVGLSQARIAGNILALAKASGELTRANEFQGKAWDENNAVTKEAAKRYATTEAQIEIAKNALTDIGITIGNVVLPRINELISKLAPLVTKFADFAEKNPQLVTGLLTAGAAVGALGAALVGLGIIIPAIVTTATAMGTVFGAIGAALAAVNPVVLAVVAVIGLLTLAWKKNFLGIQDIVGGVIDLFKGFWEMVKTDDAGMFVDALEKFGLGAESIWRPFGIFAGQLRDTYDLFLTLGQVLSGFWEVFRTDDIMHFSDAMKKLGASDEVILFFGKFAGFLRDLPMLFQQAVQQIMAFFQPLLDWFMNFVYPLLESVFGLITGVINLSIQGWIWIFKGWMFVIQEVIAFLQGIFQPIVTAIMGFITQMIQNKIAIWQERFNAAKTIILALASFLQKVFAPVVKGVMEAVSNTIKAKIDSWIENFNTVKGVIEGVIGVFQKLIDKAREAVSAAAGKLDVQSFADGGFVPRTGLSLLHKGEFVASTDMLEGRKSVPSSVENVFNQPINIQVNGSDGQDMNLMGDRVAFALRNSR